DGQALQVDTAKGSGTGARAGEAGEHSEIQGWSHEGRAHHRVPARVPCQQWFECGSGTAGRRRKIGALYPRYPELERNRVSVQDQFDTDWPIAKQYAAGVQV